MRRETNYNSLTGQSPRYQRKYLVSAFLLLGPVHMNPGQGTTPG